MPFIRSSLFAGMMMFRSTGMDTQLATMVAFLRLVTKQKVVPLRYHNHRFRAHLARENNLKNG